jgi:hypothetical protein
MRIDLAPAPQPAPRHLFLHIFCNFGDLVYSFRYVAAGVPSFFSLATVAKAAQKKALPKRRSPNACALKKGLSIPKAAKRKKESRRLDRSIRPQQRPDIKKGSILWEPLGGGRAETRTAV